MRPKYFLFLLIALFPINVFAQPLPQSEVQVIAEHNKDIREQRMLIGKLPIAPKELTALAKIKTCGLKEVYYREETDKPRYAFYGPFDDNKKHVVSLVFPNGLLRNNNRQRYPIPPEVFLSIKYLDHLKYLSLEGTNLTDEILLKDIVVISSLEIINVANTTVTDDGINKAKAINPKLKFVLQASNSPPLYWQKSYADYLENKGVYVTHSYGGPSIYAKGENDSLTGLNYRWNYSSDYLKRSNINALSNIGQGITGVSMTPNVSAQLADFAFLEFNTKMIYFDGRGIAFTDEIIRLLRRNTGLRALVLDGDLITDNGIKEILVNFPDLQLVGIHSTAITQQGALELLKLKELKHLILPNMDFSPANVVSLGKDRKFEKLRFRSVEVINNRIDYSVLKELSANIIQIDGIPLNEVDNLFKVQNLKSIITQNDMLRGILPQKVSQLRLNLYVNTIPIYNWMRVE